MMQSSDDWRFATWLLLMLASLVTLEKTICGVWIQVTRLKSH